MTALTGAATTTCYRHASSATWRLIVTLIFFVWSEIYGRMNDLNHIAMQHVHELGLYLIELNTELLVTLLESLVQA